MTAPKLASRTMKARRESVCDHCKQPIRVGQQIAKTYAWLHAGCAIALMYRDSTEGTR